MHRAFILFPALRGDCAHLVINEFISGVRGREFWGIALCFSRLILISSHKEACVNVLIDFKCKACVINALLH